MLYRHIGIRQFGFPAEVHASKLPAWTTRLNGAVRLLRRAVRRRDKSLTVTALEDVQFWIGRTVADLMAAERGGANGLRIRRATLAIARAHGPIRDAHQLLES